MLKQCLTAVVLTVVSAFAATAHAGGPFTSTPNVFGGHNYSNGVTSSKNVFGGFNYQSPSAGFSYSTPNVFGGSNFHGSGGAFSSSTPNVFGGFNYSGGGYSHIQHLRRPQLLRPLIPPTLNRRPAREKGEVAVGKSAIYHAGASNGSESAVSTVS